MGEEFPRLSYKRVEESQKKLRNTLREWAEENKVVTDEDVKDKFWSTLNKATWGMHYRKRFGKIHPAWRGMTLSKVLTMLLRADAAKIKVGSKYERAGEKNEISIGHFWDKILERLEEGPFGEAIENALNKSPERESKGEIDVGGKVED